MLWLWEQPEGQRRSLGASKEAKAPNVRRNMLIKFSKSDSEHKVSKDIGNLLICLKCFSAYEWYYKLEADIEEFAFDDYGHVEEGEVEAGVTEAG